MTATRVAVIGCGRIGTTEHLPGYQAAARHGLAGLVGVCDIDPDRAAAAGGRYGVPAFASVDQLLELAAPEVVSIATLPSRHRDLALQAFDAGCHVLCEKPVAMNLAEAEQMVRAAHASRRLLSICFEYRYWDESQHLRRRIADGELGHVHFVRTWGGMPRGFPYFRPFSETGGGAMAHWTIHNVDLALWLLGNPDPLTVSAFGFQRALRLAPGSIIFEGQSIPLGAPAPDTEDFAAAFVRLSGDSVLVVEGNYLQPPSARPEGLELLGDRGAASISPMRQWHDDGRDWVDVTPQPGTLAPCDYNMSRLIGAFLHAVRSGEPAPVAADEIVRIQRVMDAFYESAERGHEISISGSVPS